MTSIEITTSNSKNNNARNEFRTKTYEVLSKEFQELYPKAARAYQLVGLMYDRLTLIENLTHKEAKSKIIKDHKQIPGFSERNIRRYLPSNNSNVPHRLRTPWPNNSITPTEGNEKLSNVEQKKPDNPVLKNNITKEQNAGHLPVVISKHNVDSTKISTSNQGDRSSMLQSEKSNQSASNTTSTTRSNYHICPDCEKLVIESSRRIAMLEEALKKATSFSTADDIYNRSLA